MTVINFEPIVYGEPLAPLPPPPVLWVAGQHIWTSGGKSWDLSGGTQGVGMQPGVRGLSVPEFVRFKDVGPAVAGSRYRGYNTLERDIMWPIWVFHRGSSKDWLQVDRDFWASLHPDRTGVWTYTASDGLTSRTMTCRFVSDNGKSWDDDPGLFGWQPYMVSMIAEDPFWYGPRIEQPFGGDEESEKFYGPDGGPGGPPYYIGGQFTLANGRVSNPGDEPAWPKWTLYGPFTTAAVGIGGRSIEVPFTVADGAWVYIDTAPASRKVMHGTGTPGPSTGTNRYSDLGLRNWASIPPGSDLALDMTMAGTGSITVAIDPAYHRAY